MLRAASFLLSLAIALPLAAEDKAPTPPEGFKVIFNVQTFPAEQWHDYRVLVEGNHHRMRRRCDANTDQKSF